MIFSDNSVSYEVATNKRTGYNSKRHGNENVAIKAATAQLLSNPILNQLITEHSF